MKRDQLLLFKVNCEVHGAKDAEVNVSVFVLFCHGARFSLSESEVVQSETAVTRDSVTLMLHLPTVGNYLVRTVAAVVGRGVPTKKFTWIKVE